MNCTKCKNPINHTATVCEWCGYELLPNTVNNTVNNPINNPATPNPVQKIKQKNVFEWYAKCWRQWVDFSGRARRTEFWSFALINSLIFFLLLMLLGSTADDSTSEDFFAILFFIYLFLVFVPSLSVFVRRLHDTGKSAWLLLLALIPFVGGVILFIFALLESEPKTNKWGNNPKIDS